MERYYSSTSPEKLTHVIFRLTDFHGRQNLINPAEFLQVAALELENGENFEAHVHIWKEVKISTSVAQEAWVVIEGSINVELLDPNSESVGFTTLNVGDCCITIHGGHRYESFGKSKVFEFKSGPYLGDVLDKVYVSVK